MREWDDVGRRLGPPGPSLKRQEQNDPREEPTGPREEPTGPREEPTGTRAEPTGTRAESGRGRQEDWEDEFEPRFCVRCKRRIPVMVSERQDACDDCLAHLEGLARGWSPDTLPPGPGELPTCPNCGGQYVEKEWRTDWISRAVDVAADMVAFFFTVDRNGVPIDTRSEVGPAKVMQYHCLQCDERWRPRR